MHRSLRRSHHSINDIYNITLYRVAYIYIAQGESPSTCLVVATSTDGPVAEQVGCGRIAVPGALLDLGQLLGPHAVFARSLAAPELFSSGELVEALPPLRGRLGYLGHSDRRSEEPKKEHESRS